MFVLILSLVCLVILLTLWIPVLLQTILALIALFSWKKLCILSRMRHLEQRHLSLFCFCKGALIASILLFSIATFIDLDSDGVPLYKERRLGLNYGSEDTDRDIMKDGIEVRETNNDKSLFHPQNPDINNDQICDFCNAIIRHKVKNEVHFSGVMKDSLPRSTLINICDRVLDAKNNFQFCWDSGKKDLVLLNMRCGDLAFANIPLLRKMGYYISY